jgi:hypothetical protein
MTVGILAILQLDPVLLLRMGSVRVLNVECWTPYC